MMNVNYHIIHSAKYLIYPEGTNMNILRTIHNAGFFSCCSIRLQDIMIYFNEHKSLPDEVDSSEQFAHYKGYPMENLIPFYFKEGNEEIKYKRDAHITRTGLEPQFSDYRKLEFEDVKPFVEKYFSISDHVQEIVTHYESKYQLDYDNLCAVFYRGNDKFRETQIAPYEEFIKKAREVRLYNPDVRFLVQPDETEFLEAFVSEFPDAIWFEETPHMRKQDSVMFEQMPRNERAEFGAKFLAAVIVMSRAKHLITHSGNCGIFAVFYRGNIKNVHQYLLGEWL